MLKLHIKVLFSFLLFKMKNLYNAIGVSNTTNISLIKVEKIHKKLENNSRKF